MFKTFSAALLAVSVLAAPAFAASAKTEQTPVTKSAQVKESPVIKAAPAKTSVLNANAKMSKHHTSHVRHHSQTKTHAKVSFKHASTTAKRG